ncbi:aspartyl/asparaginyl beta-hydroxylase domain-containing protein [Sphingobium boeckii]|uniref:Aspartyl/asparaginyl beta-hydroxylase (Cupin superfamily) n=1 Tax=Sphingobium boeckii TaxID=1082345 RepID=A0A7W9EFC2_9SPHN|nr:aspartyl/asparaginyl beta-hydroxylase domain-containing protein [Sphingobium boeckii]MBB5686929.1 aspartyl/asparaginyl beta-hydroxylase (cupin superfamily) [Sphingobium boeckii]
MTLTRAALESLVQEGVAALRRGDGGTARERLDQVAAAGNGFPAPWLLIAQACQLMGDDAAEERALDRLLSEDVRHLPALLMMGGVKARRGDDRAAYVNYQAALNMAAETGKIPETLTPLLQRAEQFLQGSTRRFEDHLRASLEAKGLANPTHRVRQALDLLLGKAEVFLQQPSVFYFPGLPQRQFYERDEFPWLRDVEAAIPAMQAELRVVMDQGLEFAPYVEALPGRPRPNNALLDDPSWGAFHLWRGGALVAENAARCPRTIEALSRAPIPIIAERSPMALFSLLKPGTHIKPHHGMLNTRLICHVPLITPAGCALRVGNETRTWDDGKALIFDDSFEHEAWNEGDSTRVVLLFEIWRPEIHDEERAALTTIFESINAYQGAPDPAG